MHPAGVKQMAEDVTVEVHVGEHDYQARLLNDGGINVFMEGGLVGSGDWEGGCIIRRAESLPSEVYEAIESAIRVQLDER